MPIAAQYWELEGHWLVYVSIFAHLALQFALAFRVIMRRRERR